MSEIKRGDKGRFVKGTQPGGGPGRPPRQVEADYLAAMKEEITPDHWRAICRRAGIDAIKGNGYARAWISDYLMGKPPQILNIQGADAKLMADVLEEMKAAGLTPSILFNAMLAEIASIESDDTGA